MGIRGCPLVRQVVREGLGLPPRSSWGGGNGLCSEAWWSRDQG